MPVEDYLRQVKDHTGSCSRPIHCPRPVTCWKTAPNRTSRPGQGQRRAQAYATPHAELYKQGAHSEGVRKVQQLGHLGYVGADGKPLVEDGRFGRNTDAAVRQLQKDNGLVVDGIVGPKTLEAIKEARERPLLNDERHPRNPMYLQATEGLSGCRQVPSRIATRWKAPPRP